MGRFGRTALAAALLGAVVALPASALTPPPAPAVSADRIVFQALTARNADGSVVEQFSVRPDGSEVRQLSTSGGRKGPPVAAPDSTQVAWTVGVPRSIHGIEIGSTLGGPTRLVADEVGLSALSWSPTGDRLAYPSGKSIHLAPAAAGDARNVFTTTDDDVSEVAWSPTEERVVALAHRWVDSSLTETHLWIGNPDGSGWHQVAVANPTSGAVWDPDGGRFAASASGGISIFRSDGTLDRRLPVSGFPADWSSDDRILVTTDAGLRTVDADPGAERTIVVSGHRPSLPSWSPDATQITFTESRADVGVDVYVVAAGGGEARSLPNPGLGSFATSASFVPTSFGSTTRAAGADRAATALEVSRRAFASATTAVLARKDIYADALAAAPLTGAKGPVLLTDTAQVPASVKAELRRLGVQRVLLMGTADAISPAVESDLKGMGCTVERVGGSDRFATAAAAAARLTGETHGWLVKGFDRDPARGWEDAVAVSSVAAATGEPVLLTLTDELPATTAKALDALDSVTIVGGTSAVSDAVAQAAATHATVDRVSGADRYATAAAVADSPGASVLDGATAWLASGASWPDAVAAGPGAAAGRAPLLLTDRDVLFRSRPTDTWLRSATRVRSVVLVGGTGAVSLGVAREVRRILDPR